MKNDTLVLVTALLWTGMPQAQRPSAYQARIQLLEEALVPLEQRQHTWPLSSWPKHNSLQIAWSAREEGTSSKLTRMMSPSAATLRKLIDSLAPAEQKAFLTDFFHHYLVTGEYRIYQRPDGKVVDKAHHVVTKDGHTLPINLEHLHTGNLESSSLEILREKWELWLTMTENSPFSFLTPYARDLFYDRKMPGLQNALPLAGDWWPIFGLPEKYAERATFDRQGVWKLTFKTQASYGQFEEMITDIKSHSPFFGVPQWHSMAFEGDHAMAKNLAAMAKWAWALHALGETHEGRPMFEGLLDKLDGMDGLYQVRPLGDTWQHYTIEFKFHPKNLRLRRFVQTVLAARIISGDWQGMGDLPSNLANRAKSLNFAFDLLGEYDPPTKKKLWNLLLAHSGQHHLIPFWNWKQAPFLSAQKKALLRERTRAYLKDLASLKAQNSGQMAKGVHRATQQWAVSSNIVDEMRNTLRPFRVVKHLDHILHLKTPQLASYQIGAQFPQVDTNTIHLGMEYTGRFPLEGELNRLGFAAFDKLGHSHRQAIMQNVLQDLIKEFGGDTDGIFKIEGGHGHNLGYSYVGKDAQGREWRVDWDGINRQYDFEAQKVLKDTVGLGHLELVTPKFSPRGSELEAIYRIFKRHNVSTLGQLGSGHLNVDLAPFEGRPRALARFLSIFHQHRGIISLLFQDKIEEHYTKAEITDKLSRTLRDFHGNEDQLKGLLYNQHYFNHFVGEKTRWTDINLSAYFQDVIPPEFISRDFDYHNPGEPWRRQFKVDPEVRRMELRLFQGPKDAFEAALHIRLVRAMLDKALNEDAPLSGEVQKIDHRAYLRHPQKAYSDLKKLCSQIKINCQDYYSAMIEGLNDADMFYRFFDYLPDPAWRKRETNWGKALKRGRGSDQQISSKDRIWMDGKVIEDCFGPMRLLLKT